MKAMTAMKEKQPMKAMKAMKAMQEKPPMKEKQPMKAIKEKKPMKAAAAQKRQGTQATTSSPKKFAMTIPMMSTNEKFDAFWNA
jgi:hypothetical protein